MNVVFGRWRRIVVMHQARWLRPAFSRGPCARARFSDAADTATVDAVELAVGASRLGRVRADCAHLNRLAVITIIPGFACASAVSSVATYRSIVYAVERAVGAGRLGLVR